MSRPTKLHMRSIVGLFFVCLTISEATSGNDINHPMTIRAFLPCRGSSCSMATYLEGTIERTSAEKFKDQLYGDIYLNSAGGDLIGALLLGQMIRENDASTFVGAVEEEIEGGNIRTIAQQSVCASACVFVHAAGINRSVDENGRLFVHQFYTNSKEQVSEEFAFSKAQTIAGLLLSYLDWVGVSHQLITLSSRILPSDIHELSRVEIRDLGLDTNNQIVNTWQLDVEDTSQRLFARTTTLDVPLRKPVIVALTHRGTAFSLVMAYDRSYFDRVVSTDTSGRKKTVFELLMETLADSESDASTTWTTYIDNKEAGSEVLSPSNIRRTDAFVIFTVPVSQRTLQALKVGKSCYSWLSTYNAIDDYFPRVELSLEGLGPLIRKLESESYSGP